MNMITNKKAIASMIVAILLIGLTTPIFAATKTATVKSQTLMYSSKSTSSTEKAQICAGQKVYVLNTDGNWCNVKWEVKGYAHKNYVNKSNGAVIKGGPNINSEPKKGSTRYGDLRNGNVTFLDNKKLYGDYYKVSITVTGYVQKSALNISSTGSSSTGNNKPSSSSSSSGSILAALLRLTVKGAEKGAEVTLKAFSGLLGRLNGGSSTAKPEYNLTLNKTSIEIKEGSTETITATYKERTVTPKYKSSDTSVATVDSSGTVKGIKKGNATITATYNGKKATAKVTVSAKAQSSQSTEPISNNGTTTVYLTSYHPTEGNNENFALAKVGRVLKYDNNGNIGIVHPKVHRDKTMGWYVYEYEGKNYVIVGLGTKKDGSTNGLASYQAIKFEYKGKTYDAVILDVGYGQKDTNYPTIDVFTCEDRQGVGKIKTKVQITGKKIKPITNFNNGKYQTILEY